MAISTSLTASTLQVYLPIYLFSIWEMQDIHIKSAQDRFVVLYFSKSSAVYMHGITARVFV